MSAQSSGRTPRSSISSQPSAAASSSSTPYNRKDGEIDREPSLFDGQTSASYEETDIAGTEAPVSVRGNGKSPELWIARDQLEERQSKRQRPRNSGGFLLANPAQSRLADTITRSSTSESESSKGKRKAEDGELFIHKRANGHRQKKPVGGSPLATEIIRSAPGQDGTGEEHLDQDSRSQSTYGNHQSLPSVEKNGKRGSTSLGYSADPRYGGDGRNAFGYDTDPAQIVNLALNLSESRRRNMSGGSMLTPTDAIGSRRISSISQQRYSTPYGPIGGSLRRQLREQRRISGNPSSLSRNTSGSTESGPSTSEKRTSRHSSGQEPFEAAIDHKVLFNASDATFARAEKARIVLELGYEYRRLLQYLPGLPQSSSGKNGKGVDKGHVQSTASLGREYNPLQYVRNRKVRLREKKPLTPEVDGWNDVDRVRTWVDNIRSERHARVSRLDDPFPLPLFDAFEDKPASSTDRSDLTSAKQSKQTPVTQPSRPKMDWIFAPWDLLADVYWLDQDQNIQRIEDSSRQKIIQSPASTKDGLQRTSKDYPRPPDVKKQVSLTASSTSPERVRVSATDDSHEIHERGRLRKSHQESRSSIDGEDGSRTRRTRWPKKLLRSRSSSSSGHSDRSGRIKQRRGHKIRDTFDNAALEKHMEKMIAQEVEESRSAQEAMDGEVQDLEATMHSSDQELKTKVTPQRPLGPQRYKTDMVSTTGPVPTIRRSQDMDWLGHRRASSEDLRTAPTSPMVPGLASGIVVDSSPHESPPTLTLSPTKRPFASHLGSFRRDRSKSIDRRSAIETNAIKESAPSATTSRQPTDESNLRSRLGFGDHANSYLFSSKTDVSGSRSRAQDLKSIRNHKDMSSSDSRLRSLFKGGRIAELVGNEVSKVGDMLWKKEGSSNLPGVASPASSHDTDTSDEDDRDISGLDSSPSDLSRVTTGNDGLVMRSDKPTNDGQRLYNSNLPTFRSQASKVGQHSVNVNGSPNGDHITQQQRMLNDRMRSSKFDRLAPPKIDMRNVSPSPSSGDTRSQSRNQDEDDSPASSGSRSTRGVRNSDRKLNNMLGIPGRFGTDTVAPTGLAGLASDTRVQRGRERPRFEDKRQWSISDRGVSAVRGTITKRDIARVRALLLSSGVKATEIARRNEETPTKAPPLFRYLEGIFKGPAPLLPPSQQFVFAARTLVADIESTNVQLRDSAETFSKETIEGLHTQIKDLDERVNFKLTPLVRAAADNADALSTELTTTHTLTMRQLNDAVDGILRKRRRRLRWIRRGASAIVEWMVLGIMWMVWFVVMIVRLVRGTVRGTIRSLKWLFFL